MGRDEEVCGSGWEGAGDGLATGSVTAKLPLRSDTQHPRGPLQARPRRRGDGTHIPECGVSQSHMQFFFFYVTLLNKAKKKQQPEADDNTGER